MSAYRRVAGPGYLPTYNVTPTLTYSSRWRSPPSYRLRRAMDYTNLHGGTHVRILTYFFKKQFLKFFWALSEGPRGSTPTFSNSSPRATYPGIFSRLSNPIYARGEAVEPILQRHPYAPILQRHPTQPSSSHNVSGLNHRLYTTHLLLLSWFYQGTPFQKFFGPFPAAPGLNTTIFGFPSSRYVP